MAGSLYIVSTPIGNLKDISERALTTFNSVDCVACEDTRITQRLLSHYKIKNKLIIYNDFNSIRMSDKIIQYIALHPMKTYSFYYTKRIHICTYII